MNQSLNIYIGREKNSKLTLQTERQKATLLRAVHWERFYREGYLNAIHSRREKQANGAKNS